MRLGRRAFLGTIGLTGMAPRLLAGAKPASAKEAEIWVNDVHSQLTRTRVAEMAAPESSDEVAALCERAKKAGRAVSICGGRHAMGAQPFGTDTVLIDTTKLTKVRRIDHDGGLVEVEAGAAWPELIQHLIDAQ